MAALAIGATAFTGTIATVPATLAATPPGTIVDIAVGNPDFSSLVGAVSSQGLVETLQGDGPFTVFAPVNSAFSSLPGFVQRAFADKPELLKQTLLYHVVAGDLSSGDVFAEKRIRTVEGSFVRPTMRDGKPYINGAMVALADVDASNGTIHVIDRVLLPKHVVREALHMEFQRLRTEARDFLRGMSDM